MKIAILMRYFSECTIPLANALAETNEIFLIFQIEGQKTIASAGVFELHSEIIPNGITEDKILIKKFLGEKLYNFISPNIKIVLLKYPFWQFKNILNVFTGWQFANYIKKQKIQILHIQGIILQIFYALPFIRKVPIIDTMHDHLAHSGEENWKIVWFNKQMKSNAKHIITHTKSAIKEITTHFNIPAERISYIPLGVYNIYLHWKAKEIPEENNTLLFFGRISPYKGIEYLLEAEPIISETISDIKIIIAGNGDFSSYQNKIQNPERFEIYNHYIKNEFAAELFQRANIVVLPYTDATQSGVILTCYAYEKPVIATNVGGIPDIVDNEETGYLIPSRNPEEIAQAVIKLLKNTDLRNKMKLAIRKKNNNELSWTTIAKQTINVYQKYVK